MATVRIQSADGVEATDQFFAARGGKTLAETSTDRPLVGLFHVPSSPASEEVVARRCSKNAVEIHCHGGTASVARILETFQALGYEAISWNEWIEIQQAQTPASVGSTRTEAYRDLARAQTELTASLLLDQYHGALDQEMEQIHQTADPTEKQRRVEVLLDRATWGIHLTRPWQIVLAGSPNVGKSSLLNRLLGYDRAITDATPGTTRDLVRAQTVFGGWPVELIDTAGLREGEHPVEQIGVELARGQLQSADLVLLLLDATRPPMEEEIGDRQQAIGDRAKILVVRSKADLAESRDEWGTFAETDLAADAIDTSATTGEGVEPLIAMIESRLFPTLPEPGTPIPWTERQIAVIRAMMVGRSSC